MDSLSGLWELASTKGGLAAAATSMFETDTFTDVRTKVWAIGSSDLSPRHTPILWLMHRV
eukprot:SAG11_NODE_10979_length_792_cov_1.007215_2_plen_60_part_00